MKPEIRPGRNPRGWYLGDPDLGYRQRPGFEGTLTTPEFEFAFKVNSLGFRGEEIEGEKEGRFRILMLGDSFTWGMGAGEEETYPRVLEKILEERCPRSAVEVVNAGVCRYYPRQERVLLAKTAGRLKPDLVVMSILPNDVWDTAKGACAVKVTDEGYLVGGGRKQVRIVKRFGLSWPEPFSLDSFMRMHSRFYLFLARRMDALRQVRAERGRAGADLKGALGEMLGEVARADSISRSRGGKLALVLVPQKGRFEPDDRWADFYLSFEEEVVSWCRDRGIAVFNSASWLKGGSALYWPRDGHLKPAGYADLAEGVADFLLSSGLVKCY